MGQTTPPPPSGRSAAVPDPILAAFGLRPAVSDEVEMLEERTQDLVVNMGALLPLIVTNALNALGAIIILLIGLWLSGKADLVVVRMLSRGPHFDAMLKSFFGSLARYLVLTVTLLAVLSQ